MGGLFSKSGDNAQQLQPAAVAPVDTAQQPAMVATARASGAEAIQQPLEVTKQETATIEAAPVAQPEPTPAKKGFWGSLFAKGGNDARTLQPAAVTPTEAAVQQPAEQKPVAATSQPVASETAKKPVDAAAQAAAATEAAPVAEQQPKKRPFWKLWGN
ncbi:hypothetical protein LP421_25155 [Rhizobium sp. RCAM05350]|nr:hypothetical protein LP421_25155 [Rhizobium sp. RCAM05350]